MITIDELELARLLKHKMSEKDYFETMDILHDEHSMSKDVIPIDWMRKYATKHDAVCQINIENLIRNWESTE